MRLDSVGLAAKATAFTASDFGRTMTANDGGTDHGWGAITSSSAARWPGSKFYGNGCGFDGQAANYGLVMPSLLQSDLEQLGSSPNLNDPGDGNGRLIPDNVGRSIRSDTGATGSDLSASDIGLIFPNLSNFSSSSHYNPASGYMRFMA